jgi:hypothetical protein
VGVTVQNSRSAASLIAGSLVVPDDADTEQPEIEPGSVAHNRGWASLLLAGCTYSVLSAFVWWNVWSNHPTSTTTCGCGDTSLFIWFIEWPAYAFTHGLNPLYSTTLFHPTGVNLLSNTSVLAIGVLLSPVTWLFGPVATLNVALTLAPVLSALALFALLRRWVSWAPAAFIGGLFYGFSPLVLVNLTNGYLMIGMAVVPPLVVLCLDELLLRQRRPPVATGILLGLLLALQFFIGTEALIILLIAVVIGIVVIISIGARAPGSLQARFRHASIGAVAGCITALVLLAYPTWFALAGPAHLTGSIWPGDQLGYYGAFIKDLVVPTTNSSAYVRLAQRVGGYQGAWISAQYLGVGAAVVVVGGTVLWRRDRRLWLFGAVTVASVVLALGAKKGVFLPWQLVAGLPLLRNVIPNRFMVVTSLSVSVMLGLIVDHAHCSVRRRIKGAGAELPDQPSKEASEQASREDGSTRSRLVAWIVGAIVAAVALVPTAAYLSAIVPMTTQPVVLPTWFRTIAPHLDDHQVLLVLPVPYAGIESAMTWQAVDRMRYSMVGGGGPEGVPSRSGIERKGEVIIGNATYSQFFTAAAYRPGSIASVRRALGEWGVTMVVIPDQPRLPLYDRVTSAQFAVALMTAATGQRPLHQADAWVWSGVNRDPAPAVPTDPALPRCTSDAHVLRAESIDQVASCVLATATTKPSAVGPFAL